MEMRDDSSPSKQASIGEVLCWLVVIFAFGYMGYHLARSLL